MSGVPVVVAQSASTGPTTINIAATAKTTNAKRLGMNLGGQNFWDSGQLMRQITFNNPGFEGEQWQTILHCVSVTATTCTDDNIYTAWPADFIKGASAEFIVGHAAGTTATVTGNTVSNAAANKGITVTFSGLSVAPGVGDFVVVRMEVPGGADTGWWLGLSPGATSSTEFTDLSPHTPGKQALRITVPAGGSASVASYIDDYIAGKSFMQMNGVYTLSFRAKSTGGSNIMEVVLARPGKTFFDQKIPLTTSWQDYSFQMTNVDGGQTGALALKFLLNGSALLDDATLEAAAGPNNPTAFRDEVVATLRSYNPGTLRYMDSGGNWGSSLDNLIAVDQARERPGYSNWATSAGGIPWGLEDFLVLCQAIGAEPWYTMQAGMTTQEMTNLMEFLGGPASSVYGAKRAALGQTAPWTTVFPKIHLEYGNEVWNTANPGALIDDPSSYGQRAGVIFTTAHASPYYSPNSFDLILDGFEVVPSWNQQVLAAASNYDTIDVATYFYTNFNDESSIENIFGPMFAEPEAVVDSPSGAMNQQAAVAASAAHPAKLAVYESQLQINQGTASQNGVNSAEPSLGGGIAEADNLLLAMRDLGVTDEEMFALGGYHFNFQAAAGATGAATTTPIWGSVVDMGGLTNQQRPTFLAGALANKAILPTLLNTSQTGANPTWNQALSANDSVSLTGAHYIQSFAFTDGNKLNIILMNLSRTTALPVNFAGLNAPSGAATISTLTGPSITANNENGQQVSIQTTTATLQAGATMTLPPYSMTVVSVDAPVIPIAINSISVNCPRTSLSPNASMVCTENVSGQGKYNAGVTWSVDNGTIGSDGTYVAPATVPASGKATIMVTSLQDATKTASFPISVAPNAITGVTVNCGVSSLGWGKTTTCTSSVAGTGSFTNGYSWSVSGGTITTTGNVTAPQSGTSFTVTSTSTQDPTKSATVTIALTPVLSISKPVVSSTSTSITVSWTNSILARNGVQYGTAAPWDGASTPYDNTLTLTPSYTLTGLQPGTTYNLALIAYNDTQSTGLQTSFATLKAGTTAPTITGVAVACGASSLGQGATTTCSAKVSGTGSFSTGTTWSASAGSITSAGVVTPPTIGTSMTVTATSTEDPTKSGSFTIAVTPASTITGVTMSCPLTTLVRGSSTTCAAAVTGTGAYSSAITWTTNAGSISGSGVLTAPMTGNTATVTATSTQDPTKSASFTLTLAPPATITAVTVFCPATTLVQNSTTTCVPTITGTGNYSSAVNWSTSGGSISSAGILSATTPGTVTVTATSTEDPTKTGSFAVTVEPTLTISNPKTTVTSTSITVSWTVNVAARNGVQYGTGAPWLGSSTPYDNTFTTTPSYTITGLQPGTTYNLALLSYDVLQNTGKQISVTTPAAPSTISKVTVSCAATSLVEGGTTTCSAPVTGTGSYSSTVKWTVSAGSITSSGLLTAPTTGTSVTVTATSTQDATKSGSATIQVAPASTIGTVTVSCAATSLAAGGTTTCSAPVTGTGSYSSAVKWTASAGSITSAGVLTAPTTGTSVTVTATSTQDPTKSGSATIQVAQTQALTISDPVITATSTSITVSWKLNIAARNGVQYGTAAPWDGQSTPYDNNFTTTPSYTISGLKSGTVYNIALISYTTNQSTGKVMSVKTGN